MLDVAIIGGGPAGSAAAISLKQVHPTAIVALFDMPRRIRWKPGETLSPGAMPLLESLGCASSLRQFFADGAALQSFGTQAAWGSAQPYERDFLYSLHGNGWRLDRALFDAHLLDCAEAAGVAIHRDTALLESTAADAGWHLRLQSSTKVEDHHARFVIDATGRSARFAAQRGAQPLSDDRLAAVFMHFNLRDESATLDTMIESAEDGWWYSTTIPGGVGVVAWMSDTDLIREQNLKDLDRWSALLSKSTHTRLRMNGIMIERAPMIFSANSQRLDTVSGPGWAAAGDAAMTFDPLSSQGIAKALRSGKMASFVAADFLRGIQTHDRYAILAASEYAEYQRVKSTYYAEERRWPHAPFWARRIIP